MRGCIRAVIGLSLAFGLVACGRPDAPRLTPTPATRPAVVQLGCFRPLDTVPGVRAPRIDRDAADAAAREFYRMNGATLAFATAPDGTTTPLPPSEARYLTVRRSGYGAAGSDVLANRDVWLLTYTVGRVEERSTYVAGATVSILIDAQNAAPVIECRANPR